MENAEKVGDLSQPDSGAIVEDQANVENVQSTKDNVAYETHRKLLGEKKKQQSELSELRETLQKLEQDKLLSEGKKDELIVALRKQNTEEKEGRITDQNNFAKSSIIGKFEAMAKEAGCTDPDLLMSAIDIDDLQDALNDDYSLDLAKVQKVIEDAKTRKPVLFQKQVGKIRDGVPNAISPQAKQNLDDMSQDELMNLAKAKFRK